MTVAYYFKLTSRLLDIVINGVFMIIYIIKTLNNDLLLTYLYTIVNLCIIQVFIQESSKSKYWPRFKVIILCSFSITQTYNY